MKKSLIALLTACFIVAGIARAAPADGPKNILIAYRCKPADRPALRDYLAHSEMARLRDWKAEGRLAEYQILFNPYVDSDTWDAMLVVAFADYQQAVGWKQIERKMPGGLDAAGLALATPIQTYEADLPWAEGGVSSDSARIFYVIPYEYRAEGEYRDYVDGYVLPQLRGWMKEGVLTGYRIFMNRYPVGRRWDSLFIYEYRDDAAFGQREATIAKVREPLREDPRWKQLSDKKQEIRTESDNIIAESLGER